MQDSALGYASWTSPDGSSKVIYSLSVFGDIDALVNDGYRRIPHGGVETAGLLFGKRNGITLQIEAFRPIACEHAFGPSFVLSDTDRARLREQLDGSRDDPELAAFEPLGWFIGHTRNPLTLSDREAVWFKEFFPEPGSLTLLVKPERFQPTRFVFLIRNGAGEMQTESAGSPMILPLSAQSATPAATPGSAIPVPRATDAKSAESRPAASPESSEPVPAAPPAGGVTRVRTPYAEPAQPPPPPQHITPYKREPSDGTQPSLAYPYATIARRTRTETRTGGFGGFGLQSIAVLVLAAVLGCLAGYWAYLQLPSPVIPVSVREQSGQVIVEWPASQTDSVEYAALQVNDGQWITLSPEQKSAGRATVNAPAGDLKIDLVAKHWLRDSRGIVRYIRTPKPAQ